MERKDEVIELGVASIETKGGKGVLLDQISGQGAAGIADD